MSDPPFVHLHCHTDYSLLDGASDVDRLMAAVVGMGMPAVALTDHGNLFGAVDFHHKAKKAGVHPVIGCEVYVTQGSRTDKSESNRYNHLVLLCENQEGYRNLIKLVSAGYLEGFYYKPRIDKDLLAQHAKGLIGLSACLRGEVCEALAEGDYARGRRIAYQYQDILGKGNFFLELQDHGQEQDRVVLPHMYRLSQETGIPVVATNDSHYLRKEDARAHEILVCIQTGKLLSDEKRLRFEHSEYYLKSRAEMMLAFGEVEEALDRTWEIAQRCRASLDEVEEPFPKFDVPSGHTTDTYFDYVARQGFEERRVKLAAAAKAGRLRRGLEEYSERLDKEIQIIQRMNYSSYFLIVWDFIRFARSRGIPVGPGRGSAAGSLVSYAMGITDIDPLQYGLLFERFLNPERVTMPDIDIDFCTHRRGEVIQYVTEKYGRSQVAQIITFGTLGARQAIKDVGRVLEMGFGDVDRLTKLIPNQLNIKLKEALSGGSELAEAARNEPRVREVLDVALRLEGLARNAGVHAAGVVIAPVPLTELVPLYRTSRDEIVTQYDLHGLEKLSLLKMDFLGLTTLTIVHDALGLIARHRGVQIEIEQIPLDDELTYRVFREGCTSGIFQFESPGMRAILRQCEPSRIEDLCALNALYRPGPIQGGMITDFIERKLGRKEVVYELPELKEILEETYGVIVYQEQVMQIANRLGGYSLGEADMLRRAMGKKEAEEMGAQRERFVRGATGSGFPKKKVVKIFDLMEQFAGYGFNKSHSAAYAYLAYITAYLKAHYPVEFMSALLTSETGNTDKVVSYINECRGMGIEVLPPDINSSGELFTPDGNSIRFGLSAIKNVGKSAVEAIVAARRSAGRFTTIDQFCEQVDPNSLNRRVLESLIKAGAMDSLEGSRAQLFAALTSAMEEAQAVWRNRQIGQGGLFGDSPAPLSEGSRLPQIPEFTLKEILDGEKETLGFYITGHPLDEYSEKIAELASHQTTQMEGLERGAELALCVLISAVQLRRNKEGRQWASLLLEDRQGSVEGMVFTTVYDQLKAELKPGSAVLVRGSAIPEENGPGRVSVKEIIPLSTAALNLPRLVSIRVPLTASGEHDKAAALTELFQRKPGTADVRLRLEKPRDFSIILDVSTKVRPDREFRAEVERICGPETLEVLAN